MGDYECGLACDGEQIHRICGADDGEGDLVELHGSDGTMSTPAGILEINKRWIRLWASWEEMGCEHKPLWEMPREDLSERRETRRHSASGHPPESRDADDAGS